MPVHPRLRGELRSSTSKCGSGGGSSPLTRGTRSPVILFQAKERFIPAYAGNSLEMGFVTDLIAVHPRLRGELRISGVIRRISTGSSPLTRGTLGLRPAFLKSPTVHPRLRGELVIRLASICKLLGSSPLTRGTHAVRERGKNVCRFIPAYAGNSEHCKQASDETSVHPRLRGELSSSRCRYWT